MIMKGLWTFFAFPLNLLLAALWVVGLVILWRNHKESAVTKFLLSPAATISSISLFLASCLWMGLSGDSDFHVSIIFVLVLLYMLSVVLMVTLRGWRRTDGKIRWRFLFIHAGLLIAVGSAFWGSPDSSELRVRLSEGQVAQTAYELDGSITGLRHTLELIGYSAEYSSEGKPVHYEARVSVDGQAPSTITVNNPLSVGIGQDIYLASISDDGCVLQIVIEPWRYLALAGIIMLLAGAFMLFIKGPVR